MNHYKDILSIIDKSVFLSSWINFKFEVTIQVITPAGIMIRTIKLESLILAQNERWRHA